VPSWSHVALGSDSRGGDLPTGTVEELAGGEMQNLIRKSVHERASPRLYRVFLSEKKGDILVLFVGGVDAAEPPVC